ncbi:MAG: type II secretion system GspH family protein, partial [Clostridiales Family XIII bacterium]|nr:type II secretion system GspH family protein [Clostridiales Family XIII bacterium]
MTYLSHLRAPSPISFSRKQGMTLVEIVVAIAILSIVLVGMTAAFATAANVAAKSNAQAKDSETIEKNIAGTQPTDPQNIEIDENIALPLGDY